VFLLRHLRIVALITLLAGVNLAPAPAFPKLPKYDLYGDPLPDGAAARLGTTQLRAGTRSLAFSPDGKRLVAIDGRTIREWEASDGRRLRSTRIPGGETLRPVRSEDSGTVILATRDGVELWDINSSKRLDLPLPRDFKQIDQVAVSNDRRWVLVADVVGSRPPAIRGGFAMNEPVIQLVLWDTKSAGGRVLSDSETSIVRLAFSPDGKRIVSTGGPTTKVWDTETGKLLWTVVYRSEDAHFTPDGKYLIGGPGGHQDWRIWDAASGKETTELHPPTGYVWTIAISPDGSLLALPNATDYVIWDLKAGRERHRWPGAYHSGRCVFAPDGKSVVLYDTILRRMDITTGKNMYVDVGPLGHTAPVREVFFSGDGKRLVSLGEDYTARVWDVATSKLIRAVPLGAKNIDAWAATTDANALFGVDDRLTLHRWSLAADRPSVTVDLRDAQKLDIRLHAREIKITPDGSLAMLAWPLSPEYALFRFSFSFWDPATGRLLHWGGDPGREYRGDRTRMSPDGRWVASDNAIFDTRTGAKESLQVADGSAVRGFSQDGRFVVVNDTTIELATVKAMAIPKRFPKEADAITVSHDGRMLACRWDDGSGVLNLQNGLGGRAYPDPPFARLSGGLAFGPDGRLLAAGYADGTVLLWSVSAPLQESCWNNSVGAALVDDLGHESPTTFYAAVWRLTAQPAVAVRLLRAKYPPVPAVLPKEWKKLIATLDSPRFNDREAASKRLKELGRSAFGPLRRALKGNPSPEQIRRIEAVLSELESSLRRPEGEDLRAVRAVAVLEACVTDDAFRLLSDWAERGSTPLLANEAARAVERLRSRR
jgi:WD40 repeat protein